MEMRLIRKKIDKIYDEKDSDTEPSDNFKPDLKYLYDPDPKQHKISPNEPVSDDHKVYPTLFRHNVKFYLGAKYQIEDMNEKGEITSDEKIYKTADLEKSFNDHHSHLFITKTILSQALSYVVSQEITDIGKEFEKK